MKKALKVMGLGLLVLLVVIILTMNFFMGSVVKTAVNTVGPQVLGVPVRIDDAEVRLLRGYVNIKGFVVGNPDGYKSDQMFKLKAFRIKAQPRSMLTDTVHIYEVIIDAPDITYEMSLRGSNIGTLLDMLAPEDETKDDVKPSKVVMIDRLVVSNAKVHLTSKLLQGKGVMIPLPTIELRDIGKDGKASFADAVKETIGAVSGSVVEAVTSSGKLVGDGTMAVAGAVGDAGGAVVDGGKAAVGAVAEGAGKLISGVGELFKGDDTSKADEDK